MRGGELLEEEPELVNELHNMFVDDDSNDESGNEADDSPMHGADDLDEEDGEDSGTRPSSSPEQATPVATKKSRRPVDSSSPRHKCTEMDSETGEPCGADFSRAG